MVNQLNVIDLTDPIKLCNAAFMYLEIGWNDKKEIFKGRSALTVDRFAFSGQPQPCGYLEANTATGRCVKLAVASPYESSPHIPKGSKVAIFSPTVLYESLEVGLVKEPTSTPELEERLARLRPSSSHYRPSEVSLSQHLPSVKDSDFSFQSLSPGPTSPDRFINTPALTVAVETLAPEEDEPQSDSPSSSGPNQEPPTPSPTVSNFFPDVAIGDCSSPISRSGSQRTRSSFISRSKLSSVPQRVFAKFTGARKSSKGSEYTTPSHKSGVESSRNSSEVQEYPSSERPIPISFLGGQDHPYPPSELPFSPSDAAFSPTGLYTPSDYQFTRSRLYTPSERSSIIGTPRRSSLKNPLSKLSRSFRNNSSRVSFKNLSPISSGDRPLHSPDTTSGDLLPDDLNQIQSGSPNSLTPSGNSTADPSPPSELKPSVSPPVHVVPVALPTESIDKVINQGKQPTPAANTGPYQTVNPAELVASPTVYPTEYGSPAATTVPPSSRPQSWWYSTKVIPAPNSSFNQAKTFDEEPTGTPEVTPKAATPAPLVYQAHSPAESTSTSQAFPQDQSKKLSPAAKGLFGAPTPYTKTTILPSPPLTVASNSPPSATSSVRSPHRTRRPTKSNLRKRSTSTSPRIRQTESILFPRPKDDDTQARVSQVSSPSDYSFLDPANRPLPPSVFSVTAPPTVVSPVIPLPSGLPEHVPLPASSFTTTPADPACIPLPPSASTTAPPSAYPTPPSSVPTATRGLSPKHSHLLGSRTSSRINSRFTSRRSSRRNTVTRLPSIASSGKLDSAVFTSQEPIGGLNGAALPTPPISPPANNLTSSPSKSLLSAPGSPGSVTSRRSSVFKTFSRPTSRTPSVKALKTSLTALLSPKRGNSKNASRTTLPLEESTPTQGSFHELVQEPTSFIENEALGEFAQEVPFNARDSSASNQTTPKPSRKSSFTTLLRFTPSRKSSKPQLTRTVSEPLLSQQATPKPQVYREASPLPQPQAEVHRQASPQPQLSRQSSHHRLSRKSSYHQIFTPSLKPSAHLAPNELTALPDEVFQQLPAEVIANMPMNDNIDGGFSEGFDDDYRGYNWFQNPPPKPEPPAPETISPPYVPMPGVIEQNEAFIYALQAAPSVLYAQYKQYGQLGVLAWCADFSELIEAMKQLGYEGNMFVNTRLQALATCQDLLKLKLDIKMQIIIIYLSSQVARLRRFLDGETEYNDYPVPQFPLDARANHPDA